MVVGAGTAVAVRCLACRTNNVVWQRFAAAGTGAAAGAAFTVVVVAIIAPSAAAAAGALTALATLDALSAAAAAHAGACRTQPASAEGTRSRVCACRFLASWHAGVAG